jgi:CBS-domain-containing membrane protein
VSDSLRLARRTTVGATEGRLEHEPLLIAQDVDLLLAMRRSARQPSTRIIGVVDDQGRIAGVVPVALLAEAVVAHAVPEAFFAELADIEEVGQFGHNVEARTIGEIMLPPATIAPEATLGDAFRMMHQQHLSGLYVVDGAGVPTGYIDVQELAMRYVEALEEARGSAASAVSDVQDPPGTAS